MPKAAYRPSLPYLCVKKYEPLTRGYIPSTRHRPVAPPKITVEEVLQELQRQLAESEKKGEKFEPKPLGVLVYLFSNVRALFFSGGGGPGRSQPQAIIEAVKFGLNLDNVEVVNATSVGAIQGLMITLGCTAREMKEILIKMPTETFQDWDFKSLLTFFSRWGLCRGEAMEEYFKKIIKEKTGLDDPTFKELHDAGYKKEFRIIITNVTKRQMTLFSHKTTPNHKLASSVALACRLPFLFPPLWLKNEQGELEAFTDGGLVQNYPYGIACDPEMPLDQQLGFMFLNEPEAMSMKDNNGRSILNTFWHYVYSLFWILLFPNPVALPENVKQRTVKIRVPEHSIFNFNATFDEQRYLDGCAIRAVINYIRELMDYYIQQTPKKTVTSNENSFSIKKVPMPLPAYYLAKNGITPRPPIQPAEEPCYSRVRP